MSHFTTIKTQIREEGSLVLALADVGFPIVERHPQPQPLYGYQGDLRAQSAEVIIRRIHVGPVSNDIGFQRQQDGVFHALISDYDRAKYSQDWLNRLAQRYSYRVVLRNLEIDHVPVEEIRNLDNGEIEITACENF